MRPFKYFVPAILLSFGMAIGMPYEVKQGDSLYKVARTYGLTVSELKEANGLAGTALRIGQILDIPDKMNCRNLKRETVKEQIPDALTVSEAREERPLPVDKRSTEVKIVGDTTLIVLKEMLPPESDRAGYLLIGDTLKIIKRRLKAVPDTSPTLTMRTSLTPRLGTAKVQEIVDYALTFLGTPYHYGGTAEEGGFDCSGFVRHVFANFKVDLPHSSRDQYTMGRAVGKDVLENGDLLFFTRPGRSKGVGHVGIYIGDGQFIHASSGKKNKIIISALDSTYYVKHYVGARRLAL